MGAKANLKRKKEIIINSITSLVQGGILAWLFISIKEILPVLDMEIIALAIISQKKVDKIAEKLKRVFIEH